MTKEYDFNCLSEGQTCEIKEAGAGLPDDLWETYSAFANTDGGDILLGFHEGPDRMFSIVGVSDPDGVIDMFWNAVRNPQRVSRDIMLPDGLRRETVDDKVVVIISVPRADRFDKPVCVKQRHGKGQIAYVRRGTSDCECTADDLRLLHYDAARDADRRVFDELDSSALNQGTIARYRALFAARKPSHPWLLDSDVDFLVHIGALGRSHDGSFRPTLAGLLAFGNEYEITQHLPSYLLDYREQITGETRWDERVVSTSGDWSGNLFDFHQAVIPRLFATLKKPFVLATDEGTGGNDPVREAIHEAVANALIHAFYGSESTVRIVRSADQVVVSNSGVFLIDKEVAIEGGATETRNPTLMRIFGLVQIADRAGSGLCSMFASWRKAFGVEPCLVENHGPAEVVLTLPFEGMQEGRLPGINHDALVAYVREHPGVTAQIISRHFGVGDRAAQVVLKKACDSGTLGRQRMGRAFAYWIQP